ncbi:hypothetical protein CYMTET_18762 [Cymbomonas tetramitiformis]|uniref:G-protein coupled receptors family 2 profile 2 domain-containing protein n=1 Tax=Cymbomonas tetramitiformis TaxID=36881 RepID=A0AAE0L5K0_9CHLO|nr:hypothetical protein CYMTET_18762 [Cymbomonas tetramitiformis]
MAGIDSLDIRQQEVLTHLNIGFAVVSLSGSLFIISCFLVFPDLRKFSFQLVFWLSLSDFLLGLGNVIGNPDDGTMCNVQAYSTQFFSTASVLWTTVIAFVLHQTVVYHWTDVPNLVIHFHVFVWGTSLILMILPAFTGSYG